ncbi:hypothetical protein GN157_06500 [Flavobacterium rakeshii]|uniref:Uncharacterized protein n=1 Tax=Flavobacterium rakeshii TaxID=1038845 RepID=A0A6N8HDB5_9FLAO|nr:hypothetical protein [Flavobacterium rakeshii]MUV03356.1 hypothetical protein [Flavobacterium rakeshii]
MDFLLEIVFEVIIGFLLVYPGALLRWLFFGRKQKFDNYVQKGDVYNFIISFCLIAGLGFFCATIF